MFANVKLLFIAASTMVFFSSFSFAEVTPETPLLCKDQLLLINAGSGKNPWVANRQIVVNGKEMLSIPLPTIVTSQYSVEVIPTDGSPVRNIVLGKKLDRGSFLVSAVPQDTNSFFTIDNFGNLFLLDSTQGELRSIGSFGYGLYSFGDNGNVTFDGYNKFAYNAFNLTLKPTPENKNYDPYSFGDNGDGGTFNGYHKFGYNAFNLALKPIPGNKNKVAIIDKKNGRLTVVDRLNPTKPDFFNLFPLRRLTKVLPIGADSFLVASGPGNPFYVFRDKGGIVQTIPLSISGPGHSSFITDMAIFGNDSYLTAGERGEMFVINMHGTRASITSLGKPHGEATIYQILAFKNGIISTDAAGNVVYTADPLNTEKRKSTNLSDLASRPHGSNSVTQAFVSDGKLTTVDVFGNIVTWNTEKIP